MQAPPHKKKFESVREVGKTSVGYLLQAIAAFIGMAGVSSLFKEFDIVLLLVMLGVLTFPLWYIGMGIRIGFRNIKSGFWLSFRMLMYLSVFVPFILLSYEFLYDVKEGSIRQDNETYIILNGNGGFDIAEAVLAAVILLTGGPIFHGMGWKMKRIVIPFISGLLLLPLLLILSWDDFRMIDLQQGVAINSLGEKQEAGWEEVDQVTIELFTRSTSGGRNRAPQTTPLFAFHFADQQGNTFTFDNFGYNNAKMEETLQIKEAVIAENIPLQVEEPSEEEWWRITQELEKDAVNEELFDELFTPAVP
ncbi:hypothetical protein [Oceanobacillus jeddahense]|uniref:hypothetical protein n=1 Tax=Oceanobacillus jeddahense TaxID=1462527 RepID=UPI000595C040|nr:hypothetical protein [Oceanobacillus jeddahense]